MLLELQLPTAPKQHFLCDAAVFLAHHCWTSSAEARANSGSFPKCHFSLWRSYLGGSVTPFHHGKPISSPHPSPTHGEQEAGVSPQHAAKAFPLPFETAGNLAFQAQTPAFCSPWWGTLLWLRRGFHFKRAKFSMGRTYHHLLALAGLFRAGWALLFVGFSFASSKRSCTNMFMAFCPCPDPYIL